MCLFASDSTSPVTIVLITGDGDYTYAVSKLIDRHHKVIVVAHEEASLGLKCIASQFLVWGSGELEFLPRFPQDSPNHASIHKRHGTQHEPLVYSHFDEGSQFSSTAPAVAGEILPHEPNFETALSPTDCSFVGSCLGCLISLINSPFIYVEYCFRHIRCW